MRTAEVRILARSLVCALAKDFALTEVADVLTLAGQLARKAVEIRDRRDQPASSGDC
jgi:hypothetical protein